MLVKNATNRVVPYDLEALRHLYRRKVRLLLGRSTNGKSARAIARSVKLSHPTILAILDDPERTVSRKTMIRIIQATTKAKSKPKNAPSGIRTMWFPDLL
jgi:hypothetical protein